jgi:hypothetical protein
VRSSVVIAQLLASEWVCATIIDYFVQGKFTLFGSGLSGLGKNNRVFFRKRNPYIAIDGHYGLFPLGMGWLLAALGISLNRVPGVGLGYGLDARLFRIGIVWGGLLFILFSIIKPKFVKPKWLLWLEAHYDLQTVIYMLQRIEHNPAGWKTIVFYEGLEKWAEEMALRYESQSMTQSQFDVDTWLKGKSRDNTANLSEEA